MGRHRRDAAGRAATGRATGVTHTDAPSYGSRDPLGSYAEERPTMGIAPYLNPEAYAQTYARSEAYLFEADDAAWGDGARDGLEAGERYADPAETALFPTGGFADDGGPGDGFTPDGGARRAGAHRRRKKKATTPVRTGLLGVSAAVALGTVAVATGAVPGLDNYKLGGGSSSGGDVQAADSPTNAPAELGGTSGSADGRYQPPTSRGAERSTSAAPSPSAPASSASPSKTPEKTAQKAPEKKKPTATPSKKPATTPAHKSVPAPRKPSSAVTVSTESAAAAQVLKLVNEERAKVGCSPVAANSALTRLAQAFSEDMAKRGFFDHTDPDGATPWDRAGKAGITDLGGENIARGQADAEAVMEAWMNSPGHRANILNCDFKTLGVGVQFGPGGPWWTQDFGY
ncbi:CAP domain-containing protein [Streptomyces sp. NPDC052682]|uniref:CAP domain-containing protein n=1 Tax=Streptomyces sp. NPDC052682 TaxID=3154954 RepID=UPI003437DF9F